MRKTLLGACLTLLSLFSLCAQTSTAPNVLFIMDASGSMWQKMDGDFKIAIAKRVMKGLVDGLPDNTRVGMIAYGHNRKSDCKDIETLVPLAGLDKAAFSAKLEGLNPQGMTPIARSLEFALSVVRQEKAPVTCILVSDGLETCEGDACELVRQAKAQGMAITVHVIGFGLAEKDLSALECIAQAGGGQYFPANNADELGAALEKTVEQPPADGGYLSVKITLDGQPLDGLFKVFKQGETKETAMGRTYEGPKTNPRVLLLPAGTYDMEVSAIRIDGNPKQVFRDLVIAGKDTIVRVVDFSQGIAEIKVTRNGELSDAVVSLIDPATGKAVAQGRTYRSGSSNPRRFEVLPGTYDVQIKAIEIASDPVYFAGGQQISKDKPLKIEQDFASGEIRIGARRGGTLIDAAVTVYDKSSGKRIDGARTYSSNTSNPKPFVLLAGTYKIEVKPVKDKDLKAQTFEMEVKAKGEATKFAEW
ncbi:MAG: VWA domain-containing protein [Lewinellaceae bacterium]|nr:VWA domain-containing protein [Lewinellaceae bacterium]